MVRIGRKIAITYNDETYMLKFDTEKKGVYYNASISEYVSCKILKELGFNVQDVILGTYNGEKVVACKIFSDNDNVLNDFASIKNSYSYKPGSNGYGIELNEVLETIKDQNIIDKNKLLEHFWEMFILDSLLANFDRHNGNWGFLINQKEGIVKIAPIFDCASCLYPALSEEKMQEFIEDKEEKEIKERVFIFPNSAIKIDNLKINYQLYINSLENKDLNNALISIFNKIDINKINNCIDNLVISNIRKNFYKKMINARYTYIIKSAYQKLEYLNEISKNNKIEENTQSDDDELEL